MPTRVPSRLTSAHALASVALFLALGGSAYAAAKIRARDIKTGAVTTRALKDGTIRLGDIREAARERLRGQEGDRGPRGRTGLRGPKGDRGPTGPTGATGARGRRGRRGMKGETGPQGPAGPYPETLPAKQTERGTYAVGGAATAEEPVETGVTFPIALGAAPQVRFLPAGSAATGECPGSAREPGATPGFLCVYEAEATGAAGERSVFDPSQGDAAGANAASRWGFGVRLGGAAGNVGSQGTWAVTAP